MNMQLMWESRENALRGVGELRVRIHRPSTTSPADAVSRGCGWAEADVSVSEAETLPVKSVDRSSSVTSFEQESNLAAMLHVYCLPCVLTWILSENPQAPSRRKNTNGGLLA